MRLTVGFIEYVEHSVLCSLKAAVMLIALIQPSTAPVTACSLTHSAPTPEHWHLRLTSQTCAVTHRCTLGDPVLAPAEPETKQGGSFRNPKFWNHGNPLY